MPEIVKRLRWMGVAALIVIYAVLVHLVNVSGNPSMLGAMLAAAPIFGITLAIACNPTSRLAGLMLLGTSLLAFWQCWPLIALHAGVLFWIQDVSLMLTLLVTFGRTLLHGRKPLCAQFAEMLHSPLQPAHERYARQVTLAWVVFFGAMATISTLLFFLAPLVVWSVFTNFLVLPLVAMMFIAEFMVRRRVLSGGASEHILDAVRAYLKSSSLN